MDGNGWLWRYNSHPKAKFQQVRLIFQACSNHFIKKWTTLYPNFEQDTQDRTALETTPISFIIPVICWWIQKFLRPILLCMGRYNFFINIKVIESHPRSCSLYSRKKVSERENILNLLKEDKGLWMCFSILSPNNLIYCGIELRKLN